MRGIWTIAVLMAYWWQRTNKPLLPVLEPKRELSLFQPQSINWQILPSLDVTNWHRSSCHRRWRKWGRILSCSVMDWKKYWLTTTILTWHLKMVFWWTKNEQPSFSILMRKKVPMLFPMGWSHWRTVLSFGVAILLISPCPRRWRLSAIGHSWAAKCWSLSAFQLRWQPSVMGLSSIVRLFPQLFTEVLQRLQRLSMTGIMPACRFMCLREWKTSIAKRQDGVLLPTLILLAFMLIINRWNAGCGTICLSSWQAHSRYHRYSLTSSYRMAWK